MSLPQDHYVILSPHPDDAVFSTFHVLLTKADVQVITIFSGIPAAGVLTPLDRAVGRPTQRSIWSTADLMTARPLPLSAGH